MLQHRYDAKRHELYANAKHWDDNQRQVKLPVVRHLAVVKRPAIPVRRERAVSQVAATGREVVEFLGVFVGDVVAAQGEDPVLECVVYCEVQQPRSAEGLIVDLVGLVAGELAVANQVGMQCPGTERQIIAQRQFVLRSGVTQQTDALPAIHPNQIHP